MTSEVQKALDKVKKSGYGKVVVKVHDHKIKMLETTIQQQIDSGEAKQ